MIQKIKILKTIIIIFSLSLTFSANAQTVEEIIKGRIINFNKIEYLSSLLKSKNLPF